MLRRAHSPIFRQGYVLVLALVFLGIFFATGSAYLNSVTSSARSIRASVASAQALALAEAGIDAAVYQLNQNGSYSGESNTALGAGTYTVVVSAIDTNTKRLTVTGYVPNSANPLATKTVTVLVSINTTTISFHYGAQVGAGGISMNNNSQVNGNLYSDGSISGSGTITGDVTVASSTNSLSGVTVTGTARAHSLTNCTISGDAYYQTISNCPVGGTRYPGSADSASLPMPISDAQITAWEATAAAGGVTAGPHTVSGSETLGPQEINGDLTINGTLTLSGIVWVKGNVSFRNNASLTVSSNLGNAGAILIADVPGNQSSKGTVDLSNNITISGNGNAGSYPMVLSTNSGSDAISVGNNATSVILYASKGTIEVSNNASVNQITAYELSLQNNATITYVSGLQNANFSGGAGGSWAVVPHTYSISR
ncbi:MAG: hypothetical protein KGH56_00855 [Patescibacteria group bacterium]|nr:hypothetical protein [Patescibacteria group bacterium]